jgi:hypothetical protein
LLGVEGLHPMQTIRVPEDRGREKGELPLGFLPLMTSILLSAN